MKIVLNVLNVEVSWEPGILTQDISSSVDPFLTKISSTFVHVMASAQAPVGLHRTTVFGGLKTPGRRKKSPDEVQSSPRNDSGNTTGPGTHQHAHFWPESGNTAKDRKAPGSTKSISEREMKLRYKVVIPRGPRRGFRWLTLGDKLRAGCVWAVHQDHIGATGPLRCADDL